MKNVISRITNKIMRRIPHLLRVFGYPLPRVTGEEVPSLKYSGELENFILGMTNQCEKISYK